jgi:D-3-phosphoglycerate dehydrogenase
MFDAVDALIIDLLAWLGSQPRRYSEVMDAMRPSCPRLPIWEEATERGFIARQHQGGLGAVVSVTPLGKAYLCQHRPEQQTPA